MEIKCSIALHVPHVPSITEDANGSHSLTTSSDLLYIGTFIADHFLSHLEATRSKLRRSHFLSAVTLPLARGLFSYRLVTYNLYKKMVLEKIIKSKVHN